MITVAPASIDALATISLDDLNAIAELQTRTDRKYVLDAAIVDQLVDELSDDLLVLQIDVDARSGTRRCTSTPSTSICIVRPLAVVADGSKCERGCTGTLGARCWK